MKKFLLMFSMLAAVMLSGMLMTACAEEYPITIDGVTREGEYIVSVNATVTQNRDKACAIAAVYDENNVLTGAALSNTVPAQKGAVTFPFKNKIKIGDNQTASIFVWSAGANDDMTMEPFSEKYTVKREAQTEETKIKVTIGNTTGYITELTDNSTTKAFLEMLPLTQTMNDLHGRKYWFSHTLPYDDASVQHTYDIGEFTYWCGGWVTAYYDRNDDDVIEAGSVVIGTMDNSLVEAFKSLNGSSAEVKFELANDNGKAYDFDKTYEYETQQINADNNGANIYGMAYIPKDAGDTVPTVVISHGYGGSNTTNRSYAEYLASHGIAAYCFDFRGGGYSSRSDGATTDMTIFTEKSDLNAVLDMVKGLDFVDTDNLFLMGTSQGGLVSAMTAPDRASEISGAILFYPALCIVDNTHERYSTVSAIPETTNFMGMTVGRDYFESVYDYDVYADITRYTDDVLIVHGTSDSVVPLSYSEKAAEEYSSAELKIINGGGHGFYGSDADTATEYVMEYIKNHVK